MDKNNRSLLIGGLGAIIVSGLFASTENLLHPGFGLGLWFFLMSVASGIGGIYCVVKSIQNHLDL